MPVLIFYKVVQGRIVSEGVTMRISCLEAKEGIKIQRENLDAIPQMFEFADAVVERTDPNAVEVTLQGIPGVLEDWLLNAVGIYADTALRLTGAKGARSEVSASRSAGIKHRHPPRGSGRHAVHGPRAAATGVRAR